MQVNYPGPAISFPARAPEPKAETTTTVIALCDGSTIGFEGEPSLMVVSRANRDAADRLVERIAKRVVEMQGPTVLKVDGQLSAPAYEALKAAFLKAHREAEALYG